MSDEEIIYLGPEEELTSVRERLEKAKTKRIMFVIPPETQLRSPAGWRLLHARMRELGKDVLIISSERQIRSVAKAAGFSVADSQEPPQRSRNLPGRESPENRVQRQRQQPHQARVATNDRPQMQQTRRETSSGMSLADKMLSGSDTSAAPSTLVDDELDSLLEDLRHSQKVREAAQDSLTTDFRAAQRMREAQDKLNSSTADFRAAQRIHVATEDDRKLSGRVEIAIRALADTPSEVDLLEFSEYAEALADFIKSEKTQKPLTIAIDAAWGMGKTSLMTMIRDKLKSTGEKTKQRSFPTVWFNAWKYDQEESLWAALALEILDQVRRQFALQARAQFWWKLNRKRLDRNLLLHVLLKSFPSILGLILIGTIFFVIAWFWLGNPVLEILKQLLAILGGLSVVTVAYTLAKEVYQSILRPFDLKIARYIREPNYKERIGFLAQFEEAFKLVVEAVTEDGKWPLVVFIDDLDRCAPPKLVEIIEAINTLLDTKYCIFVIAMDARTVARSIEAKYKDLQGNLEDVDHQGGLTLGQRFLEKSIQINFRIPTADSKKLKSFMDAILDPSKENQSLNASEEEAIKIEALIKAAQAEGKSLNEAADSIRTKWPDNSNEAVQRAKQGLFVKSFNDSEEVLNALREVAPYLELNPRKIKRFINSFRLQALIANRRGLLDSGVIQLGLLAKYLLIVQRWPGVIKALTLNQNFVRHVKEAHKLLAKARQNRTSITYSKDGSGTQQAKAAQAKLESFLADMQIKRLVGATDLIELLNQMSDSEIEAFPLYLYLAQTTVEISESELSST